MAISDLVGRTLGDFLVIRELGRGGMGVVYEARQLSLNRPVALKVMTGGLGLTPQGVQRFRREAEAGGRLHHTNIVPVYASGEADGTAYYAMELIGGPSLDRVVRQLRGGGGPAGPSLPADLAATGPYVEAPRPGSDSGLSSDHRYFDTVAKMVAGVADGLAHAHAAGVIHRDVKPSNLLLAPDGRLTVTDFGLARVLEAPGLTMTGEFVGTPAYMSPEQVTAGRTPLDERTDIYSLGATLYELLTLRPPFTGPGRDQVLAQIIHKDPVPPRRVNRKVPVDLETICLTAMDKDPDRRYQSAGQMADDLRRYLNRFSIAARRTGPVGRLRKWARRRPGLAAALATALVLALLAGGLAHRSYRQEREHQEQVRNERVRSALEKALLLAMGGDFAAAETEIGGAEQLGASAGELHLIRGQVAFHRRDIPRALEEIERAVALLPDSVAARSVLAVAHMHSGRWDRYAAILAEVERMSPRTAEDFLFKGVAETPMSTTSALANLNEAVRLRPSTLSRLYRAEGLAYNLMEDRLSVPGAEDAMRDALAARSAMPGNAAVIDINHSVRLILIHAYQAEGLPDKANEAIAAARRELGELNRHAPPSATANLVSRWLLMGHLGDDDRVLDEMREDRAADHPLLANEYGLLLFRRGKSAEAVAVLDRHAGIFWNDLHRAFPLAELPDGLARAYDLHRALASDRPAGWDAHNLLFVLHYLQRPGEAAAAARDLLRQPDRLPPLRPDRFRRSIQYLAGQLPEATFLRDAGGTSGELCGAHCAVAFRRLADGDLDGARDHFRACLNTRVFMYFPYQLSQAMLRRMEKDRAWPPWIKPTGSANPKD